MNDMTTRHQFLFCPKDDQRRHTSICKIKKGCAWLVVEEAGGYQCLFVPKKEKLVHQHKEKKRGG